MKPAHAVHSFYCPLDVWECINRFKPLHRLLAVLGHALKPTVAPRCSCGRTSLVRSFICRLAI
jgi:hypothetical protein